ncbi:AAA family ATPase [Candidatus Soleaferrea massiliensis]|uniref:AAA family ATPase n=1 Tax=Candidatus Soleaferrea massiliensis TaxID=1470354 RepID=UPI000693FE86|nr:AAA family ATPase [Candidatus Soleaferrea massiliensis]
MDKIDIYEYDKRNRNDLDDVISEMHGEMVSWSFFAKEQKSFSFPPGTKQVYIDISTLFYSEDKADSLISILEIIINSILSYPQSIDIFLITEKQYSQLVKDMLYFKIGEIYRLEDKLEIDNDPIKNIVDISQNEFNSVMDYLNENLFGNNLFKTRLKEELSKFRLFNVLGYQPIFSVLICGASGIGKTEIARLLHKKLAPNEPPIKINFGNYSAEHALSSLIGSPRGYIGSSKGELSDKLSLSRSKVILIDEFEKASKPVYNFFLQLLEDGSFTDSMGRDYNLEKYIIVFTSNMPKEKVGEYLSPELRSRFNLKCALYPLTLDDKIKYVDFKITQMVDRVKDKTKIIVTDTDIEYIKNFDFNRIANIRDVNAEIMRRLTERIYPQLF